MTKVVPTPRNRRAHGKGTPPRSIAKPKPLPPPVRMPQVRSANPIPIPKATTKHEPKGGGSVVHMGTKEWNKLTPKQQQRLFDKNRPKGLKA